MQPAPSVLFFCIIIAKKLQKMSSESTSSLDIDVLIHSQICRSHALPSHYIIFTSYHVKNLFDHNKNNHTWVAAVLESSGNEKNELERGRVKKEEKERPERQTETK